MSNLNDELKRITGVVETSLFYNIATKAIVVSEEGTRIINKK
ncbi:MAG: ribose-5-phosphate isomerase A [Clostridiales bacterium]|nr:ribose-5-phosphate isomerase A [Clostridium sp.]MDD7681777.1 ribose-5-phosphate isomerase A [Clostridium sp.]MDD7757619.1 ribose-5-phosphate isomerase A [Clostridiales bacterium]MDY2580367.1 ribose-5-phosphate isomerase A [Clostridium sp.]